MLKNYFLVAIRDLWKSGLFSILNILGLGISISACLMVILLVRDAHNFDRFHPDSKKTYRVITNAIRKNGGSEPYATSPYPVAEALATQSSLVKKWIPLLNWFSGELTRDDHGFRFSGLATTPAFFETFGFTLKEGIPNDLNLSQVIILTAPLAKKLFPQGNAMGQSIQWNGHQDPLKVVGILNEFPGKTHLEFEALTSISTIAKNENSGEDGLDLKNWRNYYAGFHFIQLNDQSEKAAIEKEMNALATPQYSKLELESRDAGYSFELQALDEITPGRLLSNSMGKGLPSILLWFLSFLGLIIIVSAGFNHTNISLARAVSRAKEIGVRKITGATRIHIFGQFIVEAMLVALISTGVGFMLLQLIIPLFSRLQFLNSVDISLQISTSLYVWYFAFAILVGVIIGVVPALLVSKISALKSMQNLGSVRILKHLSLRKMIIVSQLSMTLIFFFLITGAVKQIKYSMRTNFAADRDYTINLDLQGLEFQKVKNELIKLPGIKAISGSSMRMGTYRDSYVDVKIVDSSEARGVRDYVIDENFVTDFNLNIIQGKNFTSDPGLKMEREVIVNESFLQSFNLGSPSEAVGKKVYVDTNWLTISGIVRDFRFKPADYAIEPLLLRYHPSDLQVMHVSVHRNSNIDQIVQDMKSTWTGLERFHPIQWSFYSEDIKAIYDSFRDIIWVISFFALLASVISLMGLLGMVTYMVTAKRKEIAIRKVIGAPLKNIYWTLSSSYIKWLSLAVVISIPLATWLMTTWLHNFAFRISWNFNWFIPGLLILGGSVLLVVSVQVLRAALSNPVFSLRNE